jgi:hypothetical protein
MRKRLAALLLVLLPNALNATSLTTVNPVAGVSKFKIEISLGGPMHREVFYHADLFRGSRSRADAFQRRLRDAIAKRFAESGISLDSAAKHTMVVGIWGRSVTEVGCESLSVAVIEASFHDETVLADPAYQGDSIMTWGRNIIEIAPDDSLESSLESAVVQLASEILQRGTKKQ